MTKSTEYKLSTIKDIFDKVPSDRVAVLLDELKVIMSNAAFVRDSFALVSGGVDHGIGFPESVTWIDDGKGEVTIQVGVDGTEGEYVQIKTNLGFVP